MLMVNSNSIMSSHCVWYHLIHILVDESINIIDTIDFWM